MAISQVDPAPIGQHMTSSKKLTRYLPIFLTATGSIGRLFTRKKKKKTFGRDLKDEKAFLRRAAASADAQWRYWCEQQQ